MYNQEDKKIFYNNSLLFLYRGNSIFHYLEFLNNSEEVILFSFERENDDMVSKALSIKTKQGYKLVSSFLYIKDDIYKSEIFKVLLERE